MEIKKYFKNRNKFVEMDAEEYNDLLSRLNFVKGGEIPSNFLNKSEVVEQDDFHHGDAEWNDHYHGER